MLLRNKALTFFCTFSILLSGCAPNSASLAPAYVSPLIYANFDCEQMQMEYARLSRRAYEASGQQDQAASDDAAMFAVGMILFWPALFAIEGQNNVKQAEVVRLKGEAEALEQAAIIKKCSGLTSQITQARLIGQNSRMYLEENKENKKSKRNICNRGGVQC